MSPIQQYIAEFEQDQQEIMKEIYKIIKENVPADTVEKISWGMPTFYLHGNLVHFAMNKHHLGFYPGESGVIYYLKQFDHSFKHSKGAIQFPLDKPLPKDLIVQIVKYRVKENLHS
ncbi:iron chaperone [Beduini massiliensis]|uniref:iron chaperone n=1 Tax=Beduini massiliensis TaxID=1585974 RepID=UPI00059AA35D|nr:DUF1801 domain-containing protein [Beduini massiliensis]